jgi:hypothetical protein
MMTETPATTMTTSKPRIRYHGHTHYSVSSRTRPGHVHHINTLNLTCSCEAGQKGRRCWALGIALQYEAWRRHEQARAQVTQAAADGSDFHQTAGYRGLAEAFGD